MGLLGRSAFTLIDLTLPGPFQALHGPGVVWADSIKATELFG